jgi:hypothetical protein
MEVSITNHPPERTEGWLISMTNDASVLHELTQVCAVSLESVPPLKLGEVVLYGPMVVLMPVSVLRFMVVMVLVLVLLVVVVMVPQRYRRGGANTSRCSERREEDSYQRCHRFEICNRYCLSCPGGWVDNPKLRYVADASIVEGMIST